MFSRGSDFDDARLNREGRGSQRRTQLVEEMLIAAISHKMVDLGRVQRKVEQLPRLLSRIVYHQLQRSVANMASQPENFLLPLGVVRVRRCYRTRLLPALPLISGLLRCVLQTCPNVDQFKGLDCSSCSNTSWWPDHQQDTTENS